MNQSSIRRRVFLTGLAVAVAAETISGLLIHTLSIGETVAGEDAIAAILGTAPMPPMPLYLLAGAGTACAVIAASVSVGKRFEKAIWMRPLVATGQLALTLYVAHVVVGISVLGAMGRLENQTLPFSLLASAVFFIVSVLFAHLWRSRFARGPVEMLMRSMTERMK